MKNIYYLAHYDILNREKVRGVSPAAVNMINYVLSKLSMAGYKTNIISFAPTDRKGKYPYGKEEIKEFNATLKLFRFNYSSIRLIRKIKYLIFYAKAILYTFLNVKRNSILIIYHSTYFRFFPKILKKIKRVKIIYQIMEIYGDVLGNSNIRRKEISGFNIGDSFILINENLCKHIKTNKYTILHGPYIIRNNIEKKEQNSIINCVYSGTFDVTKGGVINAIKAFEYLDNRYQLHIMGFGSKSEILAVKKAINNSKNGKIYFHGLLLGEKYESFLKKCDIGLAPQYSDTLFNNTSFPSKIITYMNNGLQVVSSNVEVVRNSKVAKSIFFTKNDKPEELAKTIIYASQNKKDVISELKELDATFTDEFLKLIKL